MPAKRTWISASPLAGRGSGRLRRLSVPSKCRALMLTRVGARTVVERCPGANLLIRGARQPAATRPCATLSDPLEGPGEYFVLVAENGAEVKEQLVAFNARENGRGILAKARLELLGAQPCVRNREQARGERLTRRRPAADDGLSLLHPGGEARPGADLLGEALGARSDFFRRRMDHPQGGDRLQVPANVQRSEEHTSELQSLAYLVCRLLLEKKKQ